MLVVIVRDGKSSFVNKNGLVPIINTETKMCGYMNPKFNIIIPFKFEKAEGFVGKYAVVKYNGKDAVIDKKEISYIQTT